MGRAQREHNDAARDPDKTHDCQNVYGGGRGVPLIDRRLERGVARLILVGGATAFELVVRGLETPRLIPLRLGSRHQPRPTPKLQCGRWGCGG